MKAVDGFEHLCSPARVNFLAEKFDDRTMHEWEYFRSKAKGTTYVRFFDFLLDRYDASRSSIARLKARVINECSTGGHESKDCPSNQTIKYNNVLNSATDCRRCEKWVARDTCPWPGCGRCTPKDSKISHCLEHCGSYMSMIDCK